MALSKYKVKSIRINDPVSDIDELIEKLRYASNPKLKAQGLSTPITDPAVQEIRDELVLFAYEYGKQWQDNGSDTDYGSYEEYSKKTGSIDFKGDLEKMEKGEEVTIRKWDRN